MAKVLQEDFMAMLCVNKNVRDDNKWQQHYLESKMQKDGFLKKVGRLGIDITQYDEDKKTKSIERIKMYAKEGVTVIELNIFAHTKGEPIVKKVIEEEQLWECLRDISEKAKEYDMTVLPEIHGYYVDKIYDVISQRGYHTYDLFFPGLLRDAIGKQRVEILALWIQELIDCGYKPVTRLLDSDSNWVKDIQGMVPKEDVEQLIKQLKHKDVYGNENDALFCRSIQLFMPGIAQIYMDEIEAIGNETVREEQLKLLYLRNSHPAFHCNATITVEVPAKEKLIITWSYQGNRCQLEAKFDTMTFHIK